jgi:MarR family 2-MHQ and catechol resistance regulon transcriptional repressor
MAHARIDQRRSRSLEKKALVKRKNTEDRRVRRVELTPKGRALITKTFWEHAGTMEEAAVVLSQEERLMLLRLLKKLGKGGQDVRGQRTRGDG